MLFSESNGVSAACLPAGGKHVAFAAGKLLLHYTIKQNTDDRSRDRGSEQRVGRDDQELA